MRELFMTELPEGSMTLLPFDRVDRAMAMVAFPMWIDENDGRFVVDFEPVDLDDQWQPVITAGRLHLEVRRADCGAGCRCAGEFRFVGPS